MSLDIREFRFYQFLAENGLCEQIVCFNDPEHGPIYANIAGDDDELFLFCLSCEAKVYPGLPFEEKIRNTISKHIDDGK